MENFTAEAFYLIGMLIEQMKEHYGIPEILSTLEQHSDINADALLGDKDITEIRDLLKTVKTHCKLIHLDYCVRHIERMQDKLKQGYTQRSLTSSLLHLHELMMDQIERTKFLVMTDHEAKYLP
jgi:hypothetical protein